MRSPTIESSLTIAQIINSTEDWSAGLNTPGLPLKIEKAVISSLLSLSYGKSTYGDSWSIWEPSISRFRKFIWIGQLTLDLPALCKIISNNKSELGRIAAIELSFNLGVPLIASWLGGPLGGFFSKLVGFESNKVEKIAGLLMSSAIAFGVEILREKYLYNSYLFYSSPQIRQTPYIPIHPYDQPV